MNNLEEYLCNLPREEVRMYFFAYGCEVCPAKQFCDAHPEMCCRESFYAWADGGDEPCT